MKIQKAVFWKALLLTLFIFVLGVLLGYYLESSKISEIEQQQKQIEIDWADARLQNFYYQLMTPTSEFCKIAIDENLKFADKVYQEGLRLEDYEKTNRLKEEMIYEKKRYALLKIEFWMNSIFLKEKCDASYTNLVYLFKNDPNSIEKPKQDIQSKVLWELKQKYGSDLMLIPFPMDLDLAVINMVKEAHNITSSPIILINEKIKIEGVKTIEEIEKAIEDAKKSKSL